MSNQPVPPQADAPQQPPQSQSEEREVVPVIREGQPTRNEPVPPGPTERGQTIAQQLQTQTPHTSQSTQPANKSEPPEASHHDRQRQQAAQQQGAQQQVQQLRQQSSQPQAQQPPQDQGRQAPQQQAQQPTQGRRQQSSSPEQVQPPQPPQDQERQQRLDQTFELQSAPDSPPEASASHHKLDADQSSHRKQMPSESDLAKAQLELLAAANRTFLDIVQVQRGKEETACVDDGTIEIFERNQLIYEKMLDGFS